MSTPQIIRTIEEIEALHPETVIMESDGDTESAHQIQGNRFYTVAYPAVVVATGDQFRAARKALEDAS